MSAPNDQSNYPPWQLGPPVKDWDGHYRSLEEDEDEGALPPAAKTALPLPPLPQLPPPPIPPHGGNGDAYGGGGETLTPPPPNPSTTANARQVTATAASAAAAAAGGGNLAVAEDVSPNQVTVDMENQQVILPVGGNPVPFHVSTIKDVGLPAPDSTYKYLTIEIGAADMDSPVNWTFRSGIESDFLTTAYRQISDLRQRVARLAGNKRGPPPDPEALDAAENLLADPSAPPARRRRLEGPGLVYAHIAAPIPEEEREAFDEANKREPMDAIYRSITSWYVGQSRHPIKRKKGHDARHPMEKLDNFLSAKMDEPERGEQFIQFSLHQSGDRAPGSKKDWFIGDLKDRLAQWMEELEAGAAATATYTDDLGESKTIDSKTFDYVDGCEFDAWKRKYAPSAKVLSGLQKWRTERKRKECSVDECPNQAKFGDVCEKHSGRTKQQCTADGCSNQAARKSGVCEKHAGRVKKGCTATGCPKKAVKNGLCETHGTKRKRVTKLCSADDCQNQAVDGSVCIRHGAKRPKKECSADGCKKKVQKGKLCVEHGAHGFCKHCGSGALKGKEFCGKHTTPEARAAETKRAAIAQQRMEAKREATEAAEAKLLAEANHAYTEYIDGGGNLDGLCNEDLRALVKFVCKIEGKTNDAQSSYRTAKDWKERLGKVEPCWTKYFGE